MPTTKRPWVVKAAVATVSFTTGTFWNQVPAFARWLAEWLLDKSIGDAVYQWLVQAMMPAVSTDWIGLVIDYGPRTALILLGVYLFWRTWKINTSTTNSGLAAAIKNQVNVFVDFSLEEMPKHFPASGEIDYVCFSRKYRNISKAHGLPGEPVDWKVSEGMPPTHGIRCALTSRGSDTIAFLEFKFCVDFRKIIAGSQELQVRMGEKVQSARISHCIARLQPGVEHSVWLYADCEEFVDISGIENATGRALASGDKVDLKMITSEHRPRTLVSRVPLEGLRPRVRERQAETAAAKDAAQTAPKSNASSDIEAGKGQSQVRTRVHAAASDILQGWEALYAVTEDGMIQLRILTDSKPKRRDNFLLIVLGHVVLFNQDTVSASVIGNEMHRQAGGIRSIGGNNKPGLMDLLSLIAIDDYSQAARDDDMVERVGLSSIVSYRLTSHGIDYALDLARDLIRRA